MIIKITLLFLGTILAFWMSAICGGGASLILIPILNLLLPTSVVPFSLTIGTFTSSASRIVVFKKHINYKIFFWFVPFSIPAVLVGAYLIKYINPNYLQLIVALFLIGNVPQLFKSKKEEAQSEKPYPKYILAIIGFLAGFVSGITGAIGLLFNRFYLKFGLTKEQIVATRAANEVFLHFIKLVIYISLGLYSQMALWLGLAIAAATIVSSLTVKYILPYLSENLFRKIGYGAMVISGITLLMGTTDKIVKQDKIAFATIHNKGKDEAIVSWRNTDLVLEYTIDGGLEIERPISAKELPPHLNKKYTALKPNYDTIYIEKVFQFRKEPVYEFYCYKEKQLTKFEL
ncbi:MULTISPECIES: sulfite exporter TauE/SafE family protein [Elizabethkingia]|uniref:sulfite exporter TauE/SafE family protein n=1 Tax=Elizabethkingia TaxID=308865 RepID=UPI0016292F36|nr:sulfite exporter TauE/SafE family protein [Elizabethkingia anophelis]MCT4198113.1 sulfite exporter TauE/SafE family protein [Elizabethkingia anophelis]MCT4226645.1 sulfite exporter TauE/SafE family protein [Elizabethkingia anophelis]MCT4308238.1 sulfite exporter TauE/SafE family protein [Elizabethkingia anophelis]